MWNRPTLLELIQRAAKDLNGRLPGTDATLRRANTKALASMHGGATHGLHGHLAYIAEQIIYDTADGEHLERWASIYKIFRKEADFAVGPVAFTGTTGSVIPEGEELQRADGALYTLDADVTLVGGAGTGAVTAVEAGAVGNTDAGGTLSFVTPVAGVVGAVTVGAAGLAGGVDEESDDDLRARFLARVGRTPQAGTEEDYEGWALEVPGVTRAWAKSKQFGDGTVGLTFVCDDQEGSIIPGAEKVAEVAAYIETVRPTTDDVTVYAPVADPLNPTIEVDPDTAAVRAAVEAELADFVAREAVPGGTLKLSRIDEAISAAAGEESHVLTLPAADVTHASGHIAVMGTITWV